MNKRLLSLLLAAVMVLSLLPTAALAAVAPVFDEGAAVKAEELPAPAPDTAGEEGQRASVAVIGGEEEADLPGELLDVPSSMLATEAQITATPKGNLARPAFCDPKDTDTTAVATADSQEVDSVAPSGAIDGGFSGNDRWASSTSGSSHWLQVDLGTPRAVGVIRVYWERDNVIAYTVQGSLDGQTWTELFAQTERNTGNTTKVIELEAPVYIKYIKVNVTSFQSSGTKYDGTDVNWSAVSIMEVEAYRNAASIPVDVQAVADAVTFSLENGRVVMDTAAARELAGEWAFTYKMIGANLEQVVGADGTIYTPLVNTKVEMSASVERTFDGATAATPGNAPVVVTIPGTHVTNMGNPKPGVIPEIMEWYSSAAQKGQYYTLTSSSKIVAPAELSTVAAELKADIKDLFGFEPAVVNTGAAAGDIVLVLDATKADNGFDDETYLMEVTDQVVITGTHATGVYWGTRSALQALKLNGNLKIAQGTARDYPEFKVRGFVLDVGRKPASMKKLREIAKNMAWYKMNDFHVHLDDNLIGMGAYIENWDSIKSQSELTKDQYDQANAAYSAFRMESKTPSETGALPLTAKDYHYTKEEYKAFVQDSAKIGVTIVSEIDVPAHAKAITDAFPSVRLYGHNSKCPWNDHLDLTDHYAESLQIVKTIFDEYINDGVFGEAVHFGADEYYDSHPSYRRFVKDMIAYLNAKAKIKTKRVWGSLTSMSGGQGYTVTPEEAAGIQMDIWNYGWANPKAMFDLGFDIININDGDVYIVPDAGYYYDYLNNSYIYNTWTPNRFDNYWASAASSQMVGGAYAIWNDKIDTEANGIDEIEVYDRFATGLPYMALKMWGEGDKLDRTLSEAQLNVAILGSAPGTNPYHEVAPNAQSGKHFDYQFATDGTDSSGNGHNLATANEVVYENGALTVKGGTSYAKTGMDFLGYNSELTFTINVTQAPAAGGEVIFESDHLAENSAFPYNEYAIKALPASDGKWKLGFSRELYDYEFDTEFTVGTPVTLTIKNERSALGSNAGSSGTKLYVGDSTTGVAAVGKFVNKGDKSNTLFKGKTGIAKSYFQLPVARIGSKTNAFHGTIDNISATSPTVTRPEPPEEGTELFNLAAKKTVTASSGSATPEKAVDNITTHPADNTNGWVSGNMTGSGRVDGVQTPQWLIVDLGADMSFEGMPLEEIVIGYDRRCWATKFRVETADSADAENWTVLAQVERPTHYGWIANGSGQNIASESGSGNNPAVSNRDVIKKTSTPALQSTGLKRYVRLYVETMNDTTGADGTTGTSNGQSDKLIVTEFQLWARVAATESASNIRAYQSADNEVHLRWDDDGYYQVYSKAPGGNWTCLSGAEAVVGNTFTDTHYVAGTLYRVISPASDVNSAVDSVTPIDARTYDTTAGHEGWVDCKDERVTLGAGGWGTYAYEADWYGGEVHLNNSPTDNTTMELVFVGNGVQVIGDLFSTSKNGGTMTAYIDGVATTEVLNARGTDTTTQNNSILYSKTGLDNGFHTLRLVANKDGQLAIDAFRVLVPAQSVTLTAEGLTDNALTVTTGDTTLKNVTATVTPVNGSGAFAWTSSDETVATIAGETAPGLQGMMIATITPKAGGSATLTLKDGETVKGTIALTVIQSVTNVILPDNQHSATLYLNPVGSQSGTVTLTPTVMPESASNKAVTWSTSNANVATVADGVVTAVAPGTATITVTTVDGNKTTTCAVTVKSNPTGISVKDGATAVTEAEPVVIYNNKGDSAVAGKRSSVTLTAELTPAGVTETDVTWKRTDASSGLITSEAVAGHPTQRTIIAVGQNERDVGEKTIEVASVANPAVKITFKVQVRRHLVHDVTVGYTGGATEARPGVTLEAVTSALNISDAGVAGLTYQWYKGTEAIADADEKTYTLTDGDIGGVITVKVTATPSDTYFYEGERTSTNSVTVLKNAAPAAPELNATHVDNDHPKGTITITNPVAGAVYQISSDGGQTWTDATVTGGVIADLTAGDYQVRVKETATHDAGTARTVTVRDDTKEYHAVSRTITPAEGGTAVLSATSVEDGKSVTLTVTPATGYQIKSVKIGETELTGTAGVYTVTNVTADVVFAVTFEKIKVTISHTFTNLKCSLALQAVNSHEVDYGSVTEITLSLAEDVDAEAYKLPGRGGVTIVIPGKNGAADTPFTNFNYSEETGTITITGGVTQDLKITAAAVAVTYQIAHDLHHATCSLTDHTVAHKAALTITLTADQGYALPDAITVTMAEQPLTAGTDYTYTKSTGKVEFAAGKITGALKITVEAERILTPLVSVSIEGSAKVGERLVAKVNPASAANYVNYQWIRVAEDGSEEPTDIVGATGMSRVITEASVGKKIKVKVVSAADSAYTGEVTSQPTAVVIAADAPSVPVELVTLDKSALSVEMGKTAALVATVRPANATNQGLTWTSSDEEVVTVDSAGVVTPVKEGTATITVTTADGGKTATCAVTVTKATEPTPPTPPSGGGSSRPSTSTETVTNPDGSKTTTVTDNRTGTVTATTEKADGTKEVVETKKDGTVTETVTTPEGSKTQKVTDPEKNVTITATDKDGEQVAKVEIPAAIPAPETHFEDMSEAPWAEEAVHTVAGLKLVEGIGDNKYAPVAPMTRGALATVLHRLSQGKTSYKATFADVAEGQYYTEGVAWAAKAGVVTGISAEVFAPDQVITREQLAVMLARYAKLIGVDTTADAKALDQFADGAKTGPWATDSVAWCVQVGILKGKGQSTLDPTANVTRAEVAVMLDRFIALIK